MKKIMFNDEYGLTDAVLKGRKTMTRRICKEFRTLRIINANEVESVGVYSDENLVEFVMKDGSVKVSVPSYKVGEVVAVAQKYIDLKDCDAFYEALHKADPYMPLECIKDEKGAYNKMFVKAAWMPHQIRITGFNIEKLQDITDEDCLKEGVTFNSTYWIMGYEVENLWNKYDRQSHFRSARAAYAALINRPGVGHNGLWERNPYVFAYTFKLIK